MTGVRVIRLDSEVDLDGFRSAARQALRDGVGSDAVRFVADAAAEGDLFAASPAAQPSLPSAECRVPSRFMPLLEQVGRHRDPLRFDLLYAALCRIRATPGFLDIASDPLLRRLEDMARSVRRDRHKMTAFVRFREIAAPEGARFIAWYEPEHFVEEWVAPHFVDRFASMDFVILTPRVSIICKDRALTFGPGGRESDAPKGDTFSSAWDAYYRSIFNPARLSPKAMLKEMPKKYWRNLPETRQAPDLIAGARAREASMLAAPAIVPEPRAAIIAARRAAAPCDAPTAGSLEALALEAKDCRRCPLGACATRTVFGQGPSRADAMLVGEQPGDQEDLSGKPFIGPAGKVLDEALGEARLDRERLYLTNAVKHFKHEPRGKRRLHKTPNAGEIDVCRWWLDQEIRLVETPVIVTLGATALRSVAGTRDVGGRLSGETLASLRGRTIDLPRHRLVATLHPAYLLRLPDAAARRSETRRFAEDLLRARELSEEALRASA